MSSIFHNQNMSNLHCKPQTLFQQTPIAIADASGVAFHAAKDSDVDASAANKVKKAAHLAKNVDVVACAAKGADKAGRPLFVRCIVYDRPTQTIEIGRSTTLKTLTQKIFRLMGPMKELFVYESYRKYGILDTSDNSMSITQFLRKVDIRGSRVLRCFCIPSTQTITVTVDTFVAPESSSASVADTTLQVHENSEGSVGHSMEKQAESQSSDDEFEQFECLFGQLSFLDIQNGSCIPWAKNTPKKISQSRKCLNKETQTLNMQLIEAQVGPPWEAIETTNNLFGISQSLDPSIFLANLVHLRMERGELQPRTRSFLQRRKRKRSSNDSYISSKKHQVNAVIPGQQIHKPTVTVARFRSCTMFEAICLIRKGKATQTP